jgi:hypothetical protein
VEQKALVDNFLASKEARRTSEKLPLRVTFPAVGPSALLVSELTAEGSQASIDFEYRKDNKGGVR